MGLSVLTMADGLVILVDEVHLKGVSPEVAGGRR